MRDATKISLLVAIFDCARMFYPMLRHLLVFTWFLLKVTVLSVRAFSANSNGRNNHRRFLSRTEMREKREQSPNRGIRHKRQLKLYRAEHFVELKPFLQLELFEELGMTLQLLNLFRRLEL
jgi:hypothetical protein